MIKNKEFIWNTIGTTLNSFLSLFLLIIVTRINGLEAAGSFSFIFTLSILLQSLSNYGGRIYQVSDLNEKFSFQEYLGSRLKTSFLALIVLILFCLFYKLDTITLGVSICLFILRVIETFSDVFYGSFQKQEHLEWAGISLVLKSLLIIFLFLLFDVFTHNLFISTVGMVVASIIIFLIYDLPKILKKEKIFFKFKSNILIASKYIFLFSFITFFIINAPRFVANTTLTPEHIGYLGILMMIPTVMALVSQFIVQPQIVSLSKAYHEKQKKAFNEIVKKLIILLISCGFICCVAAITIGPFTLELLYGIPFDNYRIAFVILILAGTLNGITTIFSNILVIFRETKKQFYAYSLVLIINLASSYLLSKSYGLNGLLYAIIITMIIQCLIFCFLYKKAKKFGDNL